MYKSYYSQDISAGLPSLDNQIFKNYIKLAEDSLASLKALYTVGDLRPLTLSKQTSDLEVIEPIAEYFCENFNDVIILGTGGSSLGGQAICEINHFAGSSRPTLHFMDNIDPDTFNRLFQKITPEHTGFIVISKSGNTAETLTQFLYCLDVFRSLVADSLISHDIKHHFIVITDPGNSPLRRLAEKWQVGILDHDPEVGGRYSALSIVGLLPALIAGIDAYQIREGANTVIQQMMSANTINECAPAIGAVLNVALAKESNVNITILMPYLDRLACFGAWFQQLWSESLGKDNQGTTPIRALGAVDQHSQLQLYLDGPKDKFFTLLMAEQKNNGGLIPDDLADDPELKFIAGKRMGDLMAAEQEATASALIKNKCPTRILYIKSLNEKSLGALLMHFILETIIAADLMGVNAFDQPAVEEGKALARLFLSDKAMQ